MGVGQRRIGTDDERADRQRHGRGHRHKRIVAAQRAPHRHEGLHQRQRQREDERVMAEFDDHGIFVPVVGGVAAAVSPSFQRPCFFSASATSRGI